MRSPRRSVSSPDDAVRARDHDLGRPGRGGADARAGGRRRRLPPRHRARHRARRAPGRRRARLRARRQERVHDERRVLHRRRRAARDADDPAAGPRPRRLRRDARPRRRRRRRHRRHAEAGAGVLRRQGRGGPLRRALREAALDRALRVRLAPHRPLDRLPLERRRAGPDRPAGRRRPGLDTGRRVGYRRPRPPAHRHIRFEERSTLTRRKLALAAAAFVIAGAAAVLALGTSPGRAKSNAAFKVAWIYVGPHNDGGWSQAHDEGRQYVQKMLGSKVQTTYKENIAVGAQLQQTVASLVSQGYKMIFGTSYGFFDKALAAKYPNVLFEQATGTDVAKNLAEYFGRAEDTVFLSGMAAGAAASAARGLGQNVDSPATGQYAESQHIPGVGYDSDASKFAPKSWLTASVYNWGLYYLRRVKASMNGTCKPGFYYGTINDGFTKLAPYGPGVSAKAKAAIAKKEKQLENGSWYEFQGPLYDQSGKLRVKKGVRMQVLKGGTNSLYGMNWLVKGVIGSPKG